MATGLITSPSPWLLGTVATPVWFQSVQDNINGWLNGTSNLWPTVTGITTPTPTFTKNVVYGDILPLAWGIYKNGAGFTGGANIASFVRNSAGNFTVTLSVGSTNTDTIMGIACVSNAVGTKFDYQTEVTGLSSFNIYTSVAGTPTDATRTYFVAYGI